MLAHAASVKSPKEKSLGARHPKGGKVRNYDYETLCW